MPDDALLVATDKIATLQTRKTEVLDELQQVKKEILIEKARRARLANKALPVASLPNEILSAIFLLCRGIKIVFFFFLERPMEFVLSHVSTHWRSVALNTASLWSKINLHVTKKTRRYELKQLSLHLKRSAQCLLDISLRYDFYGTSEILDYLTPYAQRWFRLSISAKEGLPFYLYAPLRSLSVPNLIYLSLRIEDGNPYDYSRKYYPETCSTILTQGAPSLTFFRIAGTIVGNFAPLLTTIRTFHVDACPDKTLSLAQFHSLLAALPCLVNLSLNGLRILLPEDPLQTIEPLVLPSLRSLRIQGGCMMCNKLLSLLSLPNLGSLLLNSIAPSTTVVIPSLHTLTLRWCHVNEDDFQSLSRSFPRLTTFDFDDWAHVNLRIYHLLTSDVGPSMNIPWPELHTIFLRKKCADPVGFVKACLRRSECGLPLRRVCLDRINRSYMEEEILDRLRELQPVEFVGRDEPWPTDLGYKDLDDTWW